MAQETATSEGGFTSPEWDLGNPAGMGVVTGGSHQDVPDFSVSGDRTAEIVMTHFAAYYLGYCPPILEPYKQYNTRWPHVEAGGLLGSIKRIDDFGNGRWADNPNDDLNILRELHAMGASPTEEPPMAQNVDMFIDQRITTRDMGFMDGGVDLKAYITVHNNGNPNSDRYAEARFVQSGGGGENVLYHGAVDAGGMVQIEKFDRRGSHAGNSYGNARSIAFEMCQGSEPWATTTTNMAKTLAGIILGDSRLDYGRLGPANFSLDRTVEHRDWGRVVGIGYGVANGGCPQRTIQTDGSIDNNILRQALAIVEAGGGTDPTSPPAQQYAKRRAVPKLDGLDHVKYGVKWYACRRIMKAIRPTPRLQVFSVNGNRVGEDIVKNESFLVEWYVMNDQGNDFFVTGIGTVVNADDLGPVEVSVKDR